MNHVCVERGGRRPERERDGTKRREVTVTSNIVTVTSFCNITTLIDPIVRSSSSFVDRSIMMYSSDFRRNHIRLLSKFIVIVGTNQQLVLGVVEGSVSRQDWPISSWMERVVLTSARGELILSHTGEIVEVEPRP